MELQEKLSNFGYYIFITFLPLDFKESAEFNKNKDQKDINWFTKPFAGIFRVQKRWTSFIETFVQGAAIAQSLQGFIWWGLEYYAVLYPKLLFVYTKAHYYSFVYSTGIIFKVYFFKQTKCEFEHKFQWVHEGKS